MIEELREALIDALSREQHAIALKLAEGAARTLDGYRYEVGRYKQIDRDIETINETVRQFINDEEG